MKSNFLTDCSKAVLLLRVNFVICVCLCLFHTAMSVSCSLVVTCWKRANLLALLLFLCFCLFLIRCPGSGEVLDCIVS